MNITELQQEAARWKWIACYLADCHAATLEEMPKATSKSERVRQTEICIKAQHGLLGEVMFNHGSSVDECLELVRLRCENAVRNHGTVRTIKNRKPVRFLATK